MSNSPNAEQCDEKREEGDELTELARLGSTSLSISSASPSGVRWELEKRPARGRSSEERSVIGMPATKN